MPRIDPKLLDSVFFLYESAQAASAGTSAGGTGFLVAMRSLRFPKAAVYIYAVTNWHVACAAGASTIRINSKGEGTEILDRDSSDWHFDPRYDIAVIPFPYDTTRHRISFLGVENGFLSAESIAAGFGDVGEDVFMIGRFMDYDGKQTNQPSVRFGNVSTMPVPIKQPNGRFADSYCVDAHSRSGFSGSPVYVYRTPGGDLTDRSTGELATEQLLIAGAKLALLGIHWGQFPERWEILDSDGAAEEMSLITAGKYVKGMSGMTCVLPASAIAAVLDCPGLVEHRARCDERVPAMLDAIGEPDPEQPWIMF